MFGNFNFGNFAKVLDDLGKLKEELRHLTLEVEDGAVRITFNGLQEVLRVRIAPDAATNIGRLEATVANCFNQGTLKLREKVKEEVARMTGFSIPDIANLLNL